MTMLVQKIGSRKHINDVDVVKEFGRDIYRERGYEDRYDYLLSVADEYGVDAHAVLDTADLLGPSEDFDGLIAMIQDFGFLIAN